MGYSQDVTLQGVKRVVTWLTFTEVCTCNLQVRKSAMDPAR